MCKMYTKPYKLISYSQLNIVNTLNAPLKTKVFLKFIVETYFKKVRTGATKGCKSGKNKNSRKSNFMAN